MPDQDSEKKDALLTQIGKWKTESEDLRSQLEHVWTKNTKLVKGIWSDKSNSKSKIRNKEKTFFRKIWAVKWRILAAFYQAFLKDQNTFKIQGRDTFSDPHKAGILQIITEWRRDGMMNNKSLFKKFITVFHNILDLGFGIGKMSWEYIPEQEKDSPSFKPWPNEQFYPDFFAETKDEMQYYIFESYMTKDDMKAKGFKNIDDIEAAATPESSLRAARYANDRDPLQNPRSTEYPSPGKYYEGKTESIGEKYKVWETFYKEDGKWKMVVTHEEKIYLKDPIDSPYGNIIIAIMGECLLEAHKLAGEGFPSPLESPQESYNDFLNRRKDNLALAMNKMKLVDRYANVDLQSLVNSRAGGLVMTGDADRAVRELDTSDVTQGAYMEAASDSSMMEEISGVTPGKIGMGTETKATVARINYAEANAKIELYIAITGETFIKDFYLTLARMIQRFESDEAVFMIANDTFREQQQNPFIQDEYDLDFDADCILSVGMSTVGRELEIQQLMLAWDRATMANQSLAQLLQMGAVPPEGIKMISPTWFWERLLPKLGIKDYKEAFIQIPPPQQTQGGLSPNIAGMAQPQIGDRETLPQALGQGREII